MPPLFKITFLASSLLFKQTPTFCTQNNLIVCFYYIEVAYTNLLTSGKLNTYLADIDRQAQERFEKLIEGMKQAQGITEQLNKIFTPHICVYCLKHNFEFCPYLVSYLIQIGILIVALANLIYQIYKGKSQFLIKIGKCDTEQEAFFREMDETNSKIHGIQQFIIFQPKI